MECQFTLRTITRINRVSETFDERPSQCRIVTNSFFEINLHHRIALRAQDDLGTDGINY